LLRTLNLRETEAEEGEDGRYGKCSNPVHHNPHLGSSERLPDAVDDIREVEDVGKNTGKPEELLHELMSPQHANR